MKSIQQIKKDLSAKLITKKTLTKVKGGTATTTDATTTIVNPDEVDIS